MRMALTTRLAIHGVPQRMAQAHLRHKDPRLTAGTYTDETLLPTAEAISSLPWLPTVGPSREESAIATGTHGQAASGDDTRAAHAQRAGRTKGHFGALQCKENSGKGQTPEKAQVPVTTTTCAPIHDGSTKRVIGLEPTTFTLAT